MILYLIKKYGKRGEKQVRSTFFGYAYAFLFSLCFGMAFCGAGAQMRASLAVLDRGATTIKHGRAGGQRPHAKAMVAEPGYVAAGLGGLGGNTLRTVCK